MKNSFRNSIFVFVIGLQLFLLSGSVIAATRTASVTGNWDATATWGGAAMPVAGDDVIINNGITVTVNVPASCNSITMTTGGTTTTYITISGTNTLTVGYGSGVITFSGSTSNNKSYTLNVSGGTLNCGTITMLQAAGSGVTSLSIGSGTANVAGNITLGAGGTGAGVIFTGAGTLNISGDLTTGGTFTASTGTINFNGPGAQNMGAYTYNNITLSNGGTKSALGNIIANSACTINSSVTLDMNNFTVTVGSLSGGGIIRNNIAGTKVLTVGGANTSTTFSGTIITGTGQPSLTKNGTGTLILSGANTFSGGTTVSAGTLKLSNVSALGTGAVTLSGGTLDLATDASVNSCNVTVTAASTIVSNRATSGAAITHALGTLSIGNFRLSMTVGSNVSSGTAGLLFGTTTLSASTPLFDVASGAKLTLGALSGNFNFTKQNSGQLNLSSASTRSSGISTLTAGTMVLENVSALGTTGTTLTLNGGTLDLATDASVNAYNTTIGGATTIVSDRASSGAAITHTLGTLSIGNFQLSITAGSNISSGTAGLIFGATTFSASTPVLDVSSGAALTLGALSGNFSFAKQNNGQLNLNSASTRSSGVTTLTAGTLLLGSTSALGTTGTTLVLNGGSLDLATNTSVNAYNTTVGGTSTIISDRATTGAAVAHVLGTLSIGATTLSVSQGSNVNSGTASLQFGNLTMTGAAILSPATANLLMSGTASGNFKLTKSGAGILQKITANWSLANAFEITAGTYNANGLTTTVTGLTTVSGGIYTAGSNTQTFNGGLTVSGGTFTGSTGTIAATDILLGSGTLTAPGSSVTFNVSGNWTNDGGTFNTNSGTITFNGTSAQAIGGTSTTAFNNLTVSNTGSPVSVNRDISIAATLTINASGILAPAATTIISGTGTLTGSGTAQVTRISSTPDFLSQYTIATKTLTNLAVNYNGAGDQTVDALNYSSLTISANGTRTVTCASGTIGISSVFTPTSTNTTYVISGNTVDFNGSNPQTIPAFNYNNLTSSSSGARTLASSGIIGIAGTFTKGSNTYTVTGSTVNFNGSLAQTVPAFTFNSLSLTNAAGASLSGAVNVGGTLTMSSGVFTTTIANILNITNTSVAAISGSSSSSYVNGPMTWNLLANIAADGTTYLFPVGDGSGNYRPIELVNIRTGAISPLVRITLASSGASTFDATMQSVAARNWRVELVSGNFTSSTIRITESSLAGSSVIGKSTLQAGNYTAVGGNNISSTITSNTGMTIPGYYAIGNVSIVLSDNGTQVTAANITQGSNDVVLHQSSLTVSAATTLTGMTCTTAGSYISADLTNIKVYYSTSNTFSVTGSTLLSTYTSPGAAGSKTFPSFTAQAIGAGTTVYIYITADISSVATVGNTVSVAALTTANFTFSSGGKNGSTTAGGIQTITISNNFFSLATGNWNVAATWNKILTGTITVANNNKNVTGSGTLFTTQLVVGDVIQTSAGVAIGTVASISSNTSLILVANNSGAKNALSYGKQAVPDATSDIIISGAGITVTLNTNATVSSLTVTGATAIGTNQLSIGAFTLTVSNNVSISGGSTTTRFGKILFTSASGMLDIGHNLIIGNGSSASTAILDMSNGTNLASNMKVAGSLQRNVADGIFTTGTGSTVDYTGTIAQTVNLVDFTYANLKINNTHASGASLGAAITSANVTGNLDVQSGTLTNAGLAITLASNKSFSVSNGATFILSGTTSAMVGVSGTGTKTFGTTSTVNYSGSGAQTITAENYGHLTSSSTGSRVFASSGTIGIAGTFTPGSNSYTITGSTVDFNGSGSQTIPALNYNNLTSSSSGARTLASSGTVGVAGIFTPGTNSYAVTGSTVDFNGSSPQAIPAFNYNNLTSSSSGARTLASSGTVGVAGTLTCGTNSYTVTGSTVDFNGSSSQTIPAFNYNNLTSSSSGARTLASSGTIGIGGTFTCGTNSYTVTGSTVDFNGSGAQIIPAFNYNNLTSSSSGARTLASSGTVGIAGAFTCGTNSYTITGSTVDFNGNGAQTIPAFNYNNLTSSSTGARTLASSGTVGVASTFTRGTNTYTSTGSTIDFNGAVAQSIPVFSYHNLTASGSGIKTLSGNCTVSNTLTITGNLDVSVSNYSIDLGKDWINNGTFTAQGGTITLNGSGAQTIGGGSTTIFNNITLNNSAGASLSSAQNLKGTLTLTSGTFTTTGQTFTLLSTSTGTARIAAIPASADFTGSITMQRYISSGTSGWMLLSTPVTGATLQQWADDFAIGGFPGSQYPSSTNPSIVTYDETLPGIYEDGYVTPTNITNQIVANKGYWAYVVTSAVVNVDVSGAVIKGTQNIPVTYTDDAAQPASEDGWNLVANPYPSTIDWDGAGWTKTNINDAVYTYNPTLDQYTSYVGGIGVNGGSNLIASSQGFLVQANAASPVLQITENAKNATDAAFIRNQQVLPDDVLKLSLTGNKYKDETVIRFNSQAGNTFDNGLDAMKFFSFNSAVPGIATQLDTLNYSVNSLPLIDDSISIPVKVIVGVSGTYTIKVDNSSTLPSTSCLVLEDLLTGTKTDLRTTPAYSFYINKSTTTARFLIHIGASLQVTASSVLCNGGSDGWITAKGVGNGPWDYTWKDSYGNTIQTHNGRNSVDTLYNVMKGAYTVEVNGNSGCSSLIVKQVELTEPDIISTQGTVVNANCDAADGAVLILSTSGGLAPYVFNWSNGVTGSDNLNIGNGTYTLTITDSVQCKQSFTFTVNKNISVVSAFDMSTDTVDLSANSPVLFFNTSSGSTTYTWDFGDGSATDNSVNPVHSYTLSGTYSVMLIVSDGNCTDTTTKIIIVIPGATTIPDVYNSLDQKIKMVTNDNSIDLIFDFNESTKVLINIYNSVGQQIVMNKNLMIHKDRLPVDFSNKAKGIYYIKIQAGEQMIVRKTVKL